MKTFGNKHYFSRSETKAALLLDIPQGDPYGGSVYGERNDPVTVGATAIGGGLVGGYLQGEAAKEAAKTQASAQLQSAQMAAEAARFRPVGVTGRYGSSQFAFNPQGQVTSAGYTLSPEAKAQQDRLAAMANQGLGQYEQAFGQSQALGQGGQQMMALGNQYLATSPQEQAQKYMADQQALLAGGRATDMAALRQNLQNTGRAGLATGGDAGMMQANPEMAAFYNAQRQQDLGLAAQATQGGQQYATFGAGMLGAGANAYNQMYGMQQAALNPYMTAQQGVQGLEQQGQGMLEMGSALGGRQATAGAQQGSFLNTGGQNAANSMFQANAYSPLGSALSGAGQMGMQYASMQPRQQSYVTAGGQGMPTYAGSQQSQMLNSQW